MSGNQRLIEISAALERETKQGLKDEGAFLLFDGAKAEWVPKQYVENNGDGTFTMPEWLAKEKGFI